METSCSRLHITRDIVNKLEIFKILLAKYEEEIYQSIINDNNNKKYLKTNLSLIEKGNCSNRN